MHTPLSSCLSYFFFFLLLRPPPTPTLFPYTTLFRSVPPRPRIDLGVIDDPVLQAVRGRGEAGVSHAVHRRGTREYGSALRSEEHTSELQSRFDLVCRLLLEKKKQQ